MDEEQDEVDGTSSGEDSFPPEEDLPQKQGDYAQPSALDIAPIDPNIPVRLMLPPHVGEKLQKIIASLREKVRLYLQDPEYGSQACNLLARTFTVRVSNWD